MRVSPSFMLHCKVALRVGLSGHTPTGPLEKNLIRNPCDVTPVTLMFYRRRGGACPGVGRV